MPGGGAASVWAAAFEIGILCGTESAVVVVEAMRRAARCSCSWKAESSSLREIGDGPVEMSLDLDPGRMRRVEAGGSLFAAGAMVEGVAVDVVAWDVPLDGELVESTSVVEPSICTSVKGGGDGRRGEGGAAIGVRGIGSAGGVSVKGAYCPVSFGAGGLELEEL